jgi:flagellar biosynthesis/type III secretory pathway protein FliH
LTPEGGDLIAVALYRSGCFGGAPRHGTARLTGIPVRSCEGGERDQGRPSSSILMIIKMELNMTKEDIVEAAEQAAKEVAEEAAKEAYDETYRETYDEAYREAYDEAYREAYDQALAELA